MVCLAVQPEHTLRDWPHEFFKKTTTALLFHCGVVVDDEGKAGGNVGWVERRDTHHLVLREDGYRCAPPILQCYSAPTLRNPRARCILQFSLLYLIM